MPKQIDALTSTRSFAALAVVFFHFALDIFPFHFSNVFGNGYLAVSYFFVLSGFVMLYTYLDKNTDYREFIIKRTARIVPLYLFAVIIDILPRLYLYASGKQDAEPGFFTAVFLNLTFLQSVIPGYAYTVNSPGWSLSTEMFFYLLFPFLLLLFRNRKKQFIIGTILLYISTQIIFLTLLQNNYEPGGTFYQFLLLNPLFHYNEFLIGMIGVPILYRYREQLAKVPSILWLVLIIVVMQVKYPNFYASDGLLAPVFLLVIIGIAAKEPKFLKHKTLVYLGDISYGIYILQKPLKYYVYSVLNPNFFHLEKTGVFYVYLVILIAFSAISYQFIEKPLRDKINSFAKKKKVELAPQF